MQEVISDMKKKRSSAEERDLRRPVTVQIGWSGRPHLRLELKGRYGIFGLRGEGHLGKGNIQLKDSAAEMCLARSRTAK